VGYVPPIPRPKPDNSVIKRIAGEVRKETSVIVHIFYNRDFFPSKPLYNFVYKGITCPNRHACPRPKDAEAEIELKETLLDIACTFRLGVETGKYKKPELKKMAIDTTQAVVDAIAAKTDAIQIDLM